MKSLSFALAVCAVLLLGTSQAATYDVDEALNALYYVKATYCNYSQLNDWSCAACQKYHPKFTDVHYDRNASDAFLYFSGYNPSTNEVVVAFRGTSNIQNWIIDFDAVFTDYPYCDGCKVHSGFFKAWNSVKASVFADYQRLTAKYSANSPTLLVTGHSLGASVAVLAGLDIAHNFHDNTMKLYTFGTPRVGNPTFAAWAPGTLPQGKQFRITHRADPVPHLPGEFMGYLHVPHEIWYDNDSNNVYKNCTDSSTKEDSACCDSVSFLDYKVHDHVMYMGLCTHCEYQPDSNGECPV